MLIIILLIRFSKYKTTRSDNRWNFSFAINKATKYQKIFFNDIHFREGCGKILSRLAPHSI